MSIWIGKDTRLVIQGITGREGSFHARQMIDYGTNVVAGVTPGKGGQQFEGSVPFSFIFLKQGLGETATIFPICIYRLLTQDEAFLKMIRGSSRITHLIVQQCQAQFMLGSNPL